MIELEYLRDWVWGPFLAVLILWSSFLWNTRRKDREEFNKELAILREDHSLTKRNLAEMKICFGRMDERVKGLEK